MSLARGIDSVHEQHDQLDDPAAVVIAIAATSAERLRLAALVSDHVAVILVGSREEALALLLDGNAPALTGYAAQALSPPVLAPAEFSAAVVAQPVEAHPVEPLRAIRDIAPTRLVVDSDLRVARWGDRSVPLSPLEHDVMVRLVHNMGRTLTFELLHREVWATEHLGGGADLQSVVKRLRRKLHHIGSTMRIHAVRGVGVRLVDVGEAPDSLA